MSICFRILSGRNTLCLFVMAALLLSHLELASAFAPRTIEFGAKKEDSSTHLTLSIMGEVKAPATYQVAQKEVTLKKLIQFAGGATEQAGHKVRVLRGGRSAMVLLRPGQDNFKLSAGDVVMLDRQWTPGAYVVSFDKIEKSNYVPNSQLMTHRKNSLREKQPIHRGQIVILGLKESAVVLPLWGDELTVDSLLSQWLKQSPEVAARTRIVYGRKQGISPNKIIAGMVLHVPAYLVNSEKLPRLPKPIVIGVDGKKVEKVSEKVEETAPQPGFSVTPISDLERYQFLGMGSSTPDIPSYNLMAALPASEEIPSSLTMPAELVNSVNGATKEISATETTETEVVESSIAPLLPAGQELFSVSDPQEKQASQSNDPFPVSKENDLTEMLQQTMSGNVHTARAGEVVPPPVDSSNTSEGLTIFGFIAGAVVVIGVVTVIASALKNQLMQSAYREDDEASAEQNIKKVVKKSRLVQDQITPVAPTMPTPSAVAVQEKATPVVSDPLTRAKMQKEDGLQALLENQLPILEERVLLPRELKFFGKPNLHYEFRIDASHEIKKPHLVVNREKKRHRDFEPSPTSSSENNDEQAAPVFWKAEAGLFVSSCELYQATTPSNR